MVIDWVLEIIINVLEKTDTHHSGRKCPSGVVLFCENVTFLIYWKTIVTVTKCMVYTVMKINIFNTNKIN